MALLKLSDISSSIIIFNVNLQKLIKNHLILIMGGYISCIEEQIPPLQRIQYDMTPIKSKNLPIVWLIGPPGSGRTTQANLLTENFEFSHVKVADLLRDEAKKDTDRGRIISEGLNHHLKKIPDEIIVDLIKEDMLRKVQNSKGFLINNFPKNSKQASIFVKEVGDVDALIYLTCDTSVMIKREQVKSDMRLKEEDIRKSIISYTREVREGASKFGNKLEKIRATGNEPPADIYSKIEAAISVRITPKTKITAESDYAQSQEEQEHELSSTVVAN